MSEVPSALCAAFCTDGYCMQRTEITSLTNAIGEDDSLKPEITGRADELVLSCRAVQAHLHPELAD